MNLYHGTSKLFYHEIMSEKKINPRYRSDKATKVINETLDKFTKHQNLRRGAIYLFNDIDYTRHYEYTLSLSLDNLNQRLIYVADFELSTDIFISVINKERKNQIRKNCKKYVDNFVTLEEFLKDKNKIERPEFLYFGKISVKAINSIVNNY